MNERNRADIGAGCQTTVVGCHATKRPIWGCHGDKTTSKHHEGYRRLLLFNRRHVIDVALIVLPVLLVVQYVTFVCIGGLNTSRIVALLRGGGVGIGNGFIWKSLM